MDINFYSKVVFPVIDFFLFVCLFGNLGVDYSGSI